MPCVTEQLVTHGGLGAIQYPLRGDERHDTALTDNAYFIHHPERIVHTMAKLDNVTERNVGHRQVEIIVENICFKVQFFATCFIFVAKCKKNPCRIRQGISMYKPRIHSYPLY